MRKPRVLSMVLALVMLMSCCFSTATFHVHAITTEPTIVVSDVKALPGTTTAVSIALENNPGIVSMTLHMEYDTDILTLKEVKDAGVFGETAHKPELQSPYTLVWVNDLATTDFTVTGTIVTLFFEVSATAQEGEVSPVTITYDYDRNEIYNKIPEKVRFEVDSGSVTVGEPEANPLSDFEYSTSGTEITIEGYVGGARDVIIGSKYTIGGVEYTVTAIAAESFIENTEITSVVIPETVKEIGEAAFYDCTSLTEVTVLSEDAEIGEVALGYYYISRKEDGVVDGFTIKAYPNSTAQTYAETDESITFVALEKPCEHTGGTATCKDKAICSSCGEPYGDLNPTNHTGGTEVRGASSASCNAPGYTGDTYCLGCTNKIADGTTIDPTGDHVDADGDWETNETHHFRTCTCTTVFDSAAHTGGTPTCKEKAVCSVCGTAYGSLNASNHVGDTYLVGQKETSCYEPGYTGDTYCSDCNTKIATGSPIEKDAHNPASVWSTDDTHHWKECTVVACGNIIDKAEHTGGEATCKAKAVCSVCGVAYGSLNTDNHKNTEVRDAVSAECNTPGYTGDTWCLDCNTKIATGTSIEPTGNHIDADGDWESNSTQHFHTCSCGTEFDKTGHTGGEATCKVQASCSVCGTAYGELNANNHKGTTYLVGQKEATCYEEGYTGDTYCSDCDVKISTGTAIEKDSHNPASVWSTDETHHWKECTVVACGNIIDKATHSGGEATCKAKAVCSVCGVAYGSLNADNHKNTEVRDAATESCNSPGYTGDTWCLDCNTKIATGTVIDPNGNHVDADGEWETDGTYHFHTCGCGTEFDKDNHIGGIATCRDKAVCATCGVSYGEKNATNHTGGTEVRGAYSASCNAPGYTGDTYCLGCNVKIADGTTIEPTGNHVDADGQWESNGTQHFHTCGCGTEFDKAGHTGGEATCKVQASCSVCGTAYGELNANNHKGTTYLVGQKETSCYEPGYTGDTHCSDCDVKIATGTSIEMSDHSPASVWSHDDTHHWKECTVVACGNLVDKAEHTGGEATCTAKAVCSVCNVAYGTTNANNHKNTELRGVVAAECNTPGYTGDTWCLDCNTKIATGTATDPTGNHVDADGDWETNGTQHFRTCGCGTEFDKAGHTGGEATCKVQASCSVCGTAYGELNANNHKGTTYIVGQKETSCYEPGYTGDTHCSDCDVKIATGTSIEMSDHSPASVWSTDETHHWKECTVVACGNLVDKAEHTGGEATCKAKAVCSVCNVAYGSVNANNHKNTEVRDAATESCTTPGYTGDTWCKDCETKIATGTDIPAGHKTVKVPAAEASHENAGNIEYYTCSGCELLFSDEAATTVITLADTVIAKGEHSYGDTYEKDADNHWKACACGNIIEKAAHTYGDWKVTKEATATEEGSKEKTCSVCGDTITEKIPVVKDTNSPQTGDNSNLLLWIALLFVSASCLTVCVVFKKRTKQSR